MIKADITRDSLVRTAHRRTVRHQQGHMAMDAEINEAQDLIIDRVETEALDTIGQSGGPKTGAGFAVTVNGSGQLELSAGRYYVDGILCQLDAPTLITAQPDLPGVTMPNQPGLYLAYLDASLTTSRRWTIRASRKWRSTAPTRDAPARESAGAPSSCR